MNLCAGPLSLCSGGAARWKDTDEGQTLSPAFSRSLVPFYHSMHCVYSFGTWIGALTPAQPPYILSNVDSALWLSRKEREIDQGWEDGSLLSPLILNSGPCFWGQARIYECV